MTTDRKNTAVRRTRSRALIGLSAAALMLGTTAGAMAQQPPAPPPPPAHAGPDGGPQGGPRGGPGAMPPRWAGPMDRHDGPGDHRFWRDHQGGAGPMGPHHGMHDMFSPARLAVALSAMETGIGIRPDQMDAWRSFTSALVAFAEASEPTFGGMGPGGFRMMPNADASGPADRPGGPGMMGQDATAADQDTGPDASGDPAGPGASLPGFRILERITDRAIARGEKAQELKQALANVESVLTPQQVQQARGLMRSMMRDMRAMHDMHDGRDGHGGPGDEDAGMRRGHHRHPGWHHGWDEGRHDGWQGRDDDRGGWRGDDRPGPDGGPDMQDDGGPDQG